MCACACAHASLLLVSSFPSVCVFAFPCQSFSHTKACFYNHCYIPDCDFWHCMAGMYLCACVLDSIACDLIYEI